MVEKDPKWYSLWELQEPEWLEEPEKLEELHEPNYGNKIEAIQDQLTILSNLFWELKQRVDRQEKKNDNL